MEIWPRLKKGKKSPSSINSKQQSKGCGEEEEEEEEKKKKRRRGGGEEEEKRRKKKNGFEKNCACPNGCNNMPFLSTRVGTPRNTKHTWVQLLADGIPQKSEVGNKENIPLIWGLPQAGCEGNLGGPHFNWDQIWPPDWNGAQTGFFFFLKQGYSDEEKGTILVVGE